MLNPKFLSNNRSYNLLSGIDQVVIISDKTLIKTRKSLNLRLNFLALIFFVGCFDYIE